MEHDICNERDLVSIIIPVYNAEKYILEAIESALNQTYRNIEIICVDDCSTDNSVDVIKGIIFRHQNVQLFELSENSKTSVTRNHAIENSSGRYILPLDADDKIHPEYVEKAINSFEKDQNIAVVYCNARKFGAIEGPWRLPKYNRFRMMYENLIHCSGVFRKSDWERYKGYSDSMKEGLEDWDFWLNFVEEERTFYRINEELLFYRIMDEGRTKNALKNSKKLVKQIQNNHPQLYSAFNQLKAHVFCLGILKRSLKILRRFVIRVNLKSNQKVIRIFGVKLLNKKS